MAVWEATSGLGDDGLEMRGFAVDLGDDRGVAVLGNASIWDGVLEIRNCHVGARNNVKHVGIIYIRACCEFSLQIVN